LLNVFFLSFSLFLFGDEKDLKENGIKYQAFKKELKHTDRAILDGQTEGYARILVKEGTDKILGATIVASHAGDMISEVTTAMIGKVGLSTLAASIHPYPTQQEVVRQLGDEYNRTRLTPTVKVFFRTLLAARR
jgi:pyruvate/2-oxoglutarate dehydrogenase complex dihydrolipoamide dehydrogenase (E3) component